MLVGLIASAIAGPFLLGAYTQAFDIVPTYGGHEGWPFAADASLGIAGVGTLLAAIVAFLLPTRLSRVTYLFVCLIISSLNTIAMLIGVRGVLNWLSWLGLPVLGVMLLWLATQVRSGRNNNSLLP